ncbi:MAG: hypothetical protein ACJ746_31495 [Bryobacteraceae bacterium]
MYISTRELLGQTADRSTYEAVIERYCGRITGLESLLNEPTLGPILNQMGAAALSNEALEMLANALAKSCKPSVSPIATPVQSN